MEMHTTKYMCMMYDSSRKNIELYILFGLCVVESLNSEPIQFVSFTRIRDTVCMLMTRIICTSRINVVSLLFYNNTTLMFMD